MSSEWPIDTPIDQMAKHATLRPVPEGLTVTALQLMATGMDQGWGNTGPVTGGFCWKSRCWMKKKGLGSPVSKMFYQLQEFSWEHRYFVSQGITMYYIFHIVLRSCLSCSSTACRTCFDLLLLENTFAFCVPTVEHNRRIQKECFKHLVWLASNVFIFNPKNEVINLKWQTIFNHQWLKGKKLVLCCAFQTCVYNTLPACFCWIFQRFWNFSWSCALSLDTQETAVFSSTCVAETTVAKGTNPYWASPTIAGASPRTSFLALRKFWMNCSLWQLAFWTFLKMRRWVALIMLQDYIDWLGLLLLYCIALCCNTWSYGLPVVIAPRHTAQSEHQGGVNRHLTIPNVLSIGFFFLGGGITTLVKHKQPTKGWILMLL